ncbi:hypothetical protein [Microbacterium testaceum]|uniref:hypothetical protein n=1 Tax=Microbacterium testaceum TaxID=2033 RepID=UPI0025AFE12B|nr:hypothetical protein [Microbacterium testaceum]WJS89924.1 hypothetical protein NYQ11_11375 [Microbacterium testaceum]
MSGRHASRGEIIRGLALAMVLSLALMCSACSRVIHRDDVIGTWEARDGDHVAQLVLHGDGTLDARGVPRAAVSDFPDVDREVELSWTDTVAFSGRWYFSEATSESFDTGDVYATDIVGADNVSLHAAPGGLALQYGYVERGQTLEFRLSDEAPTPVPATLSRMDLLGTWRSDDAGTLTLSDDGTFTLTDAPPPLTTQLDLPGSSPLFGQWSVPQTVLPLDEDAYVVLSFDVAFLTADGSFVTALAKITPTGDGYRLGFRDDRFEWVREAG